MIAVGASQHPAGMAQDLNPAVARLHFGNGAYVAQGAFDVRRGRGPLSRVAGMVMGLPSAGRGVPVRLEITRDAQTERWHRAFGAGSLDATFKRSGSNSIIECFGPLEFLYSMRVERRTLVLRLVAMSLRLGPICVRAPRMLSPRVRARARSGSTCRSVRACIVVLAPWGDVLLAYRGEIAEVSP